MGKTVIMSILNLKESVNSLLNLYGGVDARFKLFERFYERLNNTPVAQKVCNLIFLLILQLNKLLF